MRTDTRREQQALTLSMVGAGAIAVVAVLWGLLTGSRVILFDGVYALLGVLLTGASLRVVQMVRHGPTKRFPFGRESLVPVIVGTQGLALLGTSAYAIVDAIAVIAAGGTEIPKVSAVVYAVVTLAAAIGVAWLLVRMAPGSEVVAADAASWRAGAYLSAAMVVGFGGVLLLPEATSDVVAPYIDPALVIVAAGLVLPTSYSLLRTTAVELLEMAPAPEVDTPVRAAVTEVMSEFGLRNPVIRLSKVGGKLYVEVDHLAEPGTWPVDQVDRLRHALDERLDEFPYDSWLNVDLSTDPTWGLADAEDGR